jgi:hypothetical protein
VPNEISGPASITPTADQIAKIRSEIDIVSSNIGVLSDMLTNLRPGEEDPSDWELLRDLNTTCRTMQTRLVDLLSRIVSEELTGELLRVNDDLNNTFVRYDRYEKNRTAVLHGTRAATGQVTFSPSLLLFVCSVNFSILCSQPQLQVLPRPLMQIPLQSVL